LQEKADEKYDKLQKEKRDGEDAAAKELKNVKD
jgi:hypothetical protein